MEVVRNDMKEFGLVSVDALDHHACLEEEDCRGDVLARALP